MLSCLRRKAIEAHNSIQVPMELIRDMLPLSPFFGYQTRSTTVLCVRKGEKVVMVGDGQASMDTQILKPNVVKVRRINDNVLGGFAGSTADALTLLDALEAKLGEYPAVELAKSWRTDKYLRKLDALFLLADKQKSLMITGVGDVVEPHDGIMAIGSGGTYALSAARALIDIPDLDARAIAEKSMKIAADIDVYSNHDLTWESLDLPAPQATETDKKSPISK